MHYLNIAKLSMPLALLINLVLIIVINRKSANEDILQQQTQMKIFFICFLHNQLEQRNIKYLCHIRLVKMGTKN